MPLKAPSSNSKVEQRSEPLQERRGGNKRGVKRRSRGCSGEDQRRRAGSGSRLWSQGCLWLPWPSLHRCPSVWTAVPAPGCSEGSVPVAHGCLGRSRGSPGQPGACVWSGRCLPSRSQGLHRAQMRNSKCPRRKGNGSWEFGPAAAWGTSTNQHGLF